MEPLAVEPMQDAEACAAQLYGVPDDGIENWLDVGRRAGDDPQDLARRRLLLERFGQRAVPRLQLGEQPHVLDRDHRLVGEGLENLDLPVREWAGLTSQHDDATDGRALALHRDL